MRKLILFALLFVAFSSGAQVIKTAGVTYVSGTPAYTPSALGSEISVDTATGIVYLYNRGETTWYAMNGTEIGGGSGSPGHTPGDNRPRFFLNGDHDLYFWTGATWVQLNAGGGGGGGIYDDGANTIGAAVVATMQEEDAFKINYFNGFTALQINDLSGYSALYAPDGSSGFYAENNYAEIITDDGATLYFSGDNAIIEAPGSLSISVGGSTGTAGQVLVAQGDDTAIWANTGGGIYSDGPNNIGLGVEATMQEEDIFSIKYFNLNESLRISDEDGSIQFGAGDEGAQFTVLNGNLIQFSVDGDQKLRLEDNVTMVSEGGNVVIGGAATASQLQFLEPSGGGSSKVTIEAPALAGDVTLFWPTSDGTNGQSLTTNGSGQLGFTTVGGPSVITPSQITSDQTDYNPTGWESATLIRLSGDNGVRAIRSFAADTGGEIKTLVNVGSFPIYLAPEHASGTAAQRIAYFEEVFLMPGQSCQIYYDGTLSRWVPINPPCPGYRTDRKSVFYDMPVGPVPTAASADTEMDIFGSITLTNGAPTGTTVPFAFWNMNTGSTSSGGAGTFYPHVMEDMAWIGGSHIVARAFIRSTATLSDATNDYYYFLRIASNPSSGFFNQNNSLGLRYTHDVNSGKWEAYSRDNGGTDSVVDTGVTFAVDTDYELLVTLNKSNTEATFFINGVVVARITANLPTGVGCGPSQQLEKTAGTSARSVKCYRFVGAAIGI